MRSNYIHQQDREGYTLGIVAVYTDHHGDQTTADTKDELAHIGNRRSNIVGSHEEGTQNSTASHQMEQRVLTNQQSEYCDGAQEGNRDNGLDDTADNQEDTADEQSQDAGLTQAAAGVADEQNGSESAL